MTGPEQTRPPSTALVEIILTHNSEPLTSLEIAEQARVADATIWKGLETLRESGSVEPVDTQPFRWRLD